MALPLRCVLLALAALLFATPAALAVSPGENGRIYFYACGNPCQNFDVYSVAPGGGDLVNLTEAVTAPPGPPDSAFEPSVSADGSRIAFGVDSQATAEIWVINADGSGAKQLTNDNLLDQAPAISPDGSRIVWNQWSPFPGYTDRDLWTMGSDGSGQQLFYNGGNEERASQFTPDGQTLVMASETGDYDIRKVPAALMSPPLTTSTGVADADDQLAYEPTVSPDGAQVAFMQVPTATPLAPFDIYGVSIEGGIPTPLFDSAAGERDPSYSPDGTKMAFSADGVAMVGNADGSGEPQPLDIGIAQSPGGFEWAVKPPAGSVVLRSETRRDEAVPNGRIGKHPRKRTAKRRAKFTFSSTVPGSSFECKLDKRRFRPCKSPFRKRLKPGRHSFRLRAIGPTGVLDPTPADFRWTILQD